MKLPAFLIPVCLSFLAFGCSGEDQPPPSPFPKVVRAIDQPLSIPEKAPPASGEQEAEQESGEHQAQQMDKSPAFTENDAPENPASTENAVAEVPAAESRENAGCYVVKEGDTLSKIAAREDTMRDPLKWPILLRLNLDKLAGLPMGDDFATKELPAGMELEYLTPLEAKEGLEKQAAGRWIVNVMSVPAEAEITVPAGVLARQGYLVYVARANVKGKDYLRLRVGFFNSKKETFDQGEKIKGLLNTKDFWATKVDDVEYEEIAGFLKTR